jgi:hypothetical protein
MTLFITDDSNALGTLARAGSNAFPAFLVIDLIFSQNVLMPFFEPPSGA